MNVLVVFGSKRGGTEGVARIVLEALTEAGHKAVALPCGEAGRVLAAFDAVIVGGALYASRWPLVLCWFVWRRTAELRRIPVWCFSSGPLNDSADRDELAPTASVRGLMDRIGARGHATFGGRLSPDARGFPASAMARKRAGDWRNRDRIRAWALEVAKGLLAPHVGGAEPPAPP